MRYFIIRDLHKFEVNECLNFSNHKPKFNESGLKNRVNDGDITTRLWLRKGKIAHVAYSRQRVMC